jgi:hypothetical protein
MEEEKLPEVKHEMQPVPVIVLADLPPQVAEVLATLDVNDDGTLDAQELETDGAMDEIYAALQKLGVSDKSLELALGIAPPAVRKARRDQRKADRDAKAKSNNGTVPQTLRQAAATLLTKVTGK